MTIDHPIRLHRLPGIRQVHEARAKNRLADFKGNVDAIDLALKSWPAMSGCRDELRQFVIERSEVIALPKGKRFISLNGSGDEVYIILTGDAVVKTPDGKTPLRSAVVSVGEKKAIDRDMPRTAHVYASTNIVALKISGDDFRALREQCRLFERNLERDLRSRHTQSGSKYAKQRGFANVFSAACLGIAAGGYAEHLFQSLPLSALIGVLAFVTVWFLITNFVARATIAIAIALFAAVQMDIQASSEGGWAASFSMGDPSILSMLFGATLLLATPLIVKVLR